MHKIYTGHACTGYTQVIDTHAWDIHRIYMHGIYTRFTQVIYMRKIYTGHTCAKIQDMHARDIHR